MKASTLPGPSRAGPVRVEAPARHITEGVMKAGSYVWVLCLLAGCGELDPQDLSLADIDAGQSELADVRTEVHWDGVFQVVTVGVPYLTRLFVENSLVD